MNDELETIDPSALAFVSGGRKIHGPVQIPPEFIQGIQQLIDRLAIGLSFLGQGCDVRLEA